MQTIKHYSGQKCSEIGADRSKMSNDPTNREEHLPRKLNPSTQRPRKAETNVQNEDFEVELTFFIRVSFDLQTDGEVINQTSR